MNDFVISTIEYVRDWVSDSAPWAVNLVFALLFGVLSAIGYWLTKMMLRMVESMVQRSDTTWDDDLLSSALLSRVSMLTPGFLGMYLLPHFYNEAPTFFDTSIRIYLCVVVSWAVSALITNLYNALYNRSNLRPYAVKGVFQMVRLLIYGVAIIIIISTLVGKSPTAILAAFGGLAAVMMLVFKDTILGLVASVQISANKMLHRGDWIVMDSHKTNGEVLDISLTTIRVLNWDNSVTTIPPYAMVSESFRNYQDMRRAGGRRIDRSILIDLNSVKFLNEDKIEDLRAQGFIPTQAEGKTTNLGLLRAYLDHKLATDNRVVHDMLYMVRQMEPTPTGLPLQIYFFTSSTAWKDFEQVQSDFFDEVFATVQLFELRMFQAPSGTDFQKLAN